VKFLIDNIWLILIALVSGGALAWPSLSRSKNTLSTLQATQLLNKGKTLILDVRSADEYKAGHLRQAKNIPLSDLPARVGELNISATVLVVCQTGMRAGRGAAQLRRAGINDVYVLEGGFAAWKSQGLPVAE
jgi:rhodanese-related sulfurtransferase